MWHPNIYEVGRLGQRGVSWKGRDENASLCLALEHGIGNSMPLAFSAWHWKCG